MTSYRAKVNLKSAGLEKSGAQKVLQWTVDKENRHDP